MLFRFFTVASPKARIASGLAANFYSQVVTVLVQLLSLPILLSKWNIEQYGQWLMISAIPGYLVISDVGIMTAAANLMSMHQARHETAEVNRVFNSSLGAMLLLLPALALVGAVLLASSSFGLSHDQRVALYFLLITTLLGVACSLFDAVYRPFGRYPRAAFLLTTARVFDWLGMFAGLFIGGTLTSAALGIFVGRATGFVGIFVLARRDVPQIRWNWREFDVKLVRLLLRSGIGFLSFPFGYLLTLQGMVLLVGAQMGASMVALFSATRTLTRVLAQISDTTSRSMSPEISALYGAGREPEATRLSNRILWRVILLTICGALLLTLLGPSILQHWSHGKIHFDGTVFAFLIAGSIAAAYWQIQAVRLTATNRHSLLATIFTLSSAFALLLTYLTEPRFGLGAAAAGTCLVDVAMVIGTTVSLKRIAVTTRRA